MLLLIIGLGIVLRVLFFPHIPPGLNQDEASAAYEAYSLLLTGQDRWGNPWPIYFPSWGSGQNVLYSYLSIPAIWLWGLNLFTTRLVNLVFGILTLPLLYLCVRSVFNRRIATLSTLLLAVLPWHVMMSRWGLESNILPFFLLLGTYTVHLALKAPQPKAWIVFALVPWAVCFYAYGTSLLLVPPLLLLIGVSYRRQILRHKLLWSGALGLFLLLALPFLLFILKNNILHHPLGVEQMLPFSIPMLNAQRAEQIDASFLERLIPNIHLLLNGFGDDRIWNSPQYFLPLGIIVFPLLGVGLAQVSRQPESANLLGLWLWAGLPLFLMVPLNVNRVNGLLLPIIVLSVVGFEALRQAIAAPEIRQMLVRLTAIWLALNTCLFSGYYLSSAYSEQAADDFRVGFDQALDMGVAIASPTEALYVTETIPLNYMYVLFWRQVSPHDFQTQARYSLTPDGKFAVHRWQQFYFDQPSLQNSLQPTFVYILKANEPALCPEAPLYQIQAWQVGRCSKTTATFRDNP